MWNPEIIPFIGEQFISKQIKKNRDKQIYRDFYYYKL